MAKGKRNGKSKSGKSGDGTETLKPQRFTLARRDCKLARSITFRTQDHGDDLVQAGDIRVAEIELSEEEADALAQQKYFTRGLYISGGRGKPDKPLLAKFQPLKLAEKIESAKVSLYLGPNAGGECNLGACKLKSCELTFDVGRKILLSCLVQSTPTLDRRIGELVSRMDGGIQIRIEYEHNAEQLEADVTADQKADKPSEEDANEAAARDQVAAYERGIDSQAPAETH